MMIWKIIRTNLIKWWYVVYTPIVRKIWPTKEEKKIYEEEHPDEKEEVIPLSPNKTEYSEPEPIMQPPINSPDPNLIGNKNYNATTHSMSGEYGKGPLDDEAKAQLDAILKSNYNATDSLSIENAIGLDSDQSVPDESFEDTSSTLTQEEEDDAMEQLRQAQEIYERLRREAAEDDAKKQAEIDAAKANS